MQHGVINYICIVIPMTYCITGSLYVWPLSPILTSPQLLATTNLFCVSMNFGFLDSIYKWDHMVCVFLWIISLFIIFSRSNHVANGKIPFFSWLNNIYVWHLLSLFTIDGYLLSLVPYLGYYKWCCSEHWNADILLN